MRHKAPKQESIDATYLGYFPSQYLTDYGVTHVFGWPTFQVGARVYFGVLLTERFSDEILDINVSDTHQIFAKNVMKFLVNQVRH